MRLTKIIEALEKKNVLYTYTEEDGLGSLDLQFRGIKYHIWEFEDEGTFGVDTNVYNCGRSQDITGDYEEDISALILGWPDMMVKG